MLGQKSWYPGDEQTSLPRSLETAPLQNWSLEGATLWYAMLCVASCLLGSGSGLRTVCSSALGERLRSPGKVVPSGVYIENWILKILTYWPGTRSPMLGQKSGYPGDERPQSSAGSFGKQRILVSIQYHGTWLVPDVTACVQLESLHHFLLRQAARSNS